MKKMLCGLLAVCLVLALAPMTAFAVFEGELLVNGVDILTAPEYTVQCGDGTAVWDPDANTLTLTNATINMDDSRPTSTHTAIENPNSYDMTVVLVGENKITKTADGTYLNGIYSKRDLTVTGEGSLTIEGGRNYSLYAGYDMILDGAEVHIIEGGHDIGIKGEGSVQVVNGSVVTGEDLILLFSDYVNGDGNMLIQDSTVKIEETTPESNGICCWGELTVIRSTVTATSPYLALYGDMGLSIQDSTVTATSTDDYGIWTSGSLSISGHSTVTAQGALVGMDGYDGASVTAPEDGMVDILLGTSPEDAQLSSSSPLEPGQKVFLIGLDNYTYAKVGAHTHDLTHVPAVEPTPAKPGNIEYWYCEGCGKYFADAEGAQEITEADTYLAPEGTADIPGSNEDQVGGGDWDWPSSSGDSSTGGFASGTTTGGKENPSTGDSSLMAGVVLLAAASAGGILLSKKRK